ncbi:MAG TPA: FAD-binding oxidoreductase [Polyangiaceae bacterium]|jgi:alkyldihydroxyacetonephosphate synthase|nr:FAD-binding oxidoreductase [Polyangiaceae bacterium]
MVASELSRILGPEKVLVDEGARRARRRDFWVPSQLADVKGLDEPLPACVVRPAELSDVVTVVNVCRANRAPLVPFGLGSGVCGGVLATASTVILDMGAMNRVREIDERNLLATFDAGVRGSDAESAVAAKGLMLGHYPQSIGISSVGGWIATRAAGQFSTAYGSIEDIVFALEAVLPNGDVIETRRTPRASAGPDLRHLLLGSEGTLGVVTGVTLSIRRAPEKRLGAAFHVPSMEVGFEIQREILQRGLTPPVLRQYDGIESERMFSKYARSGDGLLVLVHEGPAAKVNAEADLIEEIARRGKGEPAAAEVAEHWLAERNHVPSFEQFFANGVVLDTIEIAATWDKIGGIYRNALAALADVPGMLTASAHSSHGYRSGLNLYFTFAARPAEPSDMKATYLECWRRVMRATVDGGGGIAHHHGIGRIRREWLRSELGDGGVSLLRTVKRALDPDGFMNPGALIPEE